ncbi:MAG: MATE family efflux transporter [Monoglobales bacterium]
MKQNDTNDFSKGSVIGNIMRIAIPMMVAQFINVLYNVVDRIYIGRMGADATNALTGLGVCLPLITVVMAFANLISSGGAPLFSIARGRGDERETKFLLGNSFLLLLIYGAAITILIYAFEEPLLRLLGASDETLPYAKDYMNIYAAGTIFVMISLGLNSFINAQGFAKTGMFTVIIGAVLNIVLDPLFIFVFGMGVKGAALATVISQLASAVWTVLFLTGKRTLIKLSVSAMRPQKKRIIKINTLGMSGFIMAATNSAVTTVCNSTLSVWGGDLYIAIMTIISSVRDVVQMPVMGMTNGIQPVIGFNYGAGCGKRVKAAIRDSAAVLIIYTGVMWIAVILFARQFLGMFSGDANVIEAGVRPLHIYFFGFVFMALQFTGQSVFTGLGKTKQAIIFSLLRKVFIVIPLTIILPYWFGVDGVFIAEPVSNVIGGTACFITMIFTVYRKIKDK